MFQNFKHLINNEYENMRKNGSKQNNPTGSTLGADCSEHSETTPSILIIGSFGFSYFIDVLTF